MMLNIAAVLCAIFVVPLTAAAHDSPDAAASVLALASIVDDKRSDDPSFVRTRCYAFFDFVGVAWAAAKPYGEQRSVFEPLMIDPDLTDATPAEVAAAKDEDLVQAYLNTIRGIWPEQNIKQPIVVADGERCLQLLEAAEEAKR